MEDQVTNLTIENVNWEQYREPMELEQNWTIRREFLEKNLGKRNTFLLVILSKAFINIKVYKIWYPKKMVKEVLTLSEGICLKNYIRDSDICFEGANRLRQWPKIKKYKRARDIYDQKKRKMYGSISPPVRSPKPEIWQELPEDEELIIYNFPNESEIERTSYNLKSVKVCPIVKTIKLATIFTISSALIIFSYCKFINYF